MMFMYWDEHACLKEKGRQSCTETLTTQSQLRSSWDKRFPSFNCAMRVTCSGLVYSASKMFGLNQQLLQYHIKASFTRNRRIFYQQCFFGIKTSQKEDLLGCIWKLSHCYDFIARKTVEATSSLPVSSCAHAKASYVSPSNRCFTPF